MSFSLIVYRLAHPPLPLPPPPMTTIQLICVEPLGGTRQRALACCHFYENGQQHASPQRDGIDPQRHRAPTSPEHPPFSSPSWRLHPLAAPLTLIKRAGGAVGDQCGGPTCIHNGPSDQFILKIQLKRCRWWWRWAGEVASRGSHYGHR